MVARTIAHLASHRAGPRPTVIGWILSMDAAFRQRAVLRSLETHMLRDIGVSQDALARELNKSVWDVPVTWRI